MPLRDQRLLGTVQPPVCGQRSVASAVVQTRSCQRCRPVTPSLTGNGVILNYGELWCKCITVLGCKSYFFCFCDPGKLGGATLFKTPGGHSYAPPPQDTSGWGKPPFSRTTQAHVEKSKVRLYGSEPPRELQLVALHQVTHFHWLHAWMNEENNKMHFGGKTKPKKKNTWCKTHFESTAKIGSAVRLTQRQQSLSVHENISQFTLNGKAQKCQASHSGTAPWRCESQTSASPWNTLSSQGASFLVWGETSDVVLLLGNTSVCAWACARHVPRGLTSEKLNARKSAKRRRGVDATEVFLQLNEANSRKKECVSFFPPPKKLKFKF